MTTYIDLALRILKCYPYSEILDYNELENMGKILDLTGILMPSNDKHIFTLSRTKESKVYLITGISKSEGSSDYSPYKVCISEDRIDIKTSDSSMIVKTITKPIIVSSPISSASDLTKKTLDYLIIDVVKADGTKHLASNDIFDELIRMLSDLTNRTSLPLDWKFEKLTIYNKEIIALHQIRASGTRNLLVYMLPRTTTTTTENLNCIKLRTIHLQNENNEMLMNGFETIYRENEKCCPFFKKSESKLQFIRVLEEDKII